MKRVLTFALALAAVAGLASCGRAAEPTETETGAIAGSMVESSSAAESEPVQDGGDTNPRTEKIKTVKYPSPHSVSAYYDLTDDQKAAYDTYAAALEEILENGPDAVIGKIFSLPHSISVTDICTAKDLLSANFHAADSLISCLTYSLSEGAQDRADSIFLYDYGHLDEYCRNYLEASAAADEILSSLTYDGTEYDKALAIAEWVVDNINYVDSPALDTNDQLCYALKHHEAVCGGYSRTYDFLCKKAGLETIYVTCNSIFHAWNMIRIGENWYHIDATWMDEDDLWFWFMAPDAAVLPSHEGACYYWDRTENKEITPRADSFDLYKYYFASSDDAVEYFESSELSDIITYPYTAAFDDEAESDAFFKMNSSVIRDRTGSRFAMNISKIDPGSTVYRVQFLNVDALYGDEQRVDG